MKTTKEMIEVMQAYDRGEQIQVKTTNKKCDWEDVKEPYWQWNFCDYRVKPKKNKIYVPFDTAEEFLAATRVHGLIIPKDYQDKKLIGYVDKDCILMLSNRTNDRIVWVKFEEFFRDFKFEDGTPCGKEVEE